MPAPLCELAARAKAAGPAFETLHNKRLVQCSKEKPERVVRLNARSGGFRVFRATIWPGAPVTSLVTRNRTGSERRLVEADLVGSVPPWRAPMAAPRLTICCATPPRWPRRKPRNGAGAAKLRGCDRLPPAHPAPRSHQLLQRRAARPVRGKSRCH